MYGTNHRNYSAHYQEKTLRGVLTTPLIFFAIETSPFMKIKSYSKEDLIMSDNTVKFEDIRRDVKKREIKEWFNTKIQKGKEFVIRNKEALIMLTPVAIKGVTTVTKVVGKHINLRKEESVKNLYCYDRSLGHYWSLKRELTNQEWLEIDRRKKNGERLADILSDFRVLK